MNFFMSDVYGDLGGGMTALTIPEAADKQALVDDHESDVAVQDSGTNYKGIIGAVIVIVVLALVMGAMK